jgi:hypothetical protein
LAEVRCVLVLDFSQVGPVFGVTLDVIPLLVLGHLISLSTVSCVLHARFTRSASKLICFLFVPVVCFLVDVVTCVEEGAEETLVETVGGTVGGTLG